MVTAVLPGSGTGDTIVNTLDRIARQCGVAVPSSWVSATRDFYVEIRDDFFLETVSDILDRIDLPGPISQKQSIVGDGSETYALNTNFLRMHRTDHAVYDPQQDRPCIPISDDGTYTFLKDSGTPGIIKYYRVRGYDQNYEIDIYSPPTGTIEVHYVTVNWMANSAGVVGSAFTSADDVLLLPRRAVEAGSVWRFRERRGLPYTDKYNEYEALLSRLSNDSRGRRVVNMGARDNNIRWQDLVPAYIPES